MPTCSKWLLCLLLTLPAAFARETEDAQSIFMSAMQRLRQHLPDTPDPPALEAYAIHDYLIAARLRRELASSVAGSEPLDESIDAFLQSRAQQPVTRALRRDWLNSLASRSRWDLFLARSADATDPTLVCQRLSGRLSAGDTTGLADAAIARWSLAQKQPQACNAVFAWLRSQGLLTPALAEARTRAALLADNPHLAREFAADVPPSRATALLRWSDLIEAPKSALNVLATHPSLSIESEALIAGFDKLSHSDPGAALTLLPTLLRRDGLDAATGERLKRAAALGAAYDRDPRAVSAFGDLTEEDTDTLVQEWRVRAALWAGDWIKALTWIKLMPPSLAAQPRWQYWHARAVEMTTGEEFAAPLYAQDAGLRDLYGYWSAGRLHRAYELNARSSPDDSAVQAMLAADPGLIRAHELFDCDMTDDAAAEWAVVMAGASAPVKVQAAHLASRWRWYSQAIATLAQSGEFDDVVLRYPRPYPQIIAEAATLAHIPPNWLLGVMRQESLFRKDAVSRADARGLMQMLPSTASVVARRWHLPPPTRDTLFDPGVAVPLGAAYLREMLDRHDGNLILTLASYNAGPAAVQRWLPEHTMDADVWMENIPYNETRGYVQHILEHIVAFAYVEGTPPPDLVALLLPIRPNSPLQD